MEVKLEQLIETIKKDGVLEAQKQSREIIKKAQKEVAQLIKESKEKAEQIISQAKLETDNFRDTAEKSIQLGGRDLILSLKEKIQEIFDALLKEKIKEELTPDYLKELIIKIVTNWEPGKENSWQVLISDEDKEQLKLMLLKSFKEKVQGEIEIKTSRALEKGFRIGFKGEEVYYDFSDESIVEALSVFINPLIAELIKGKNF